MPPAGASSARAKPQARQNLARGGFSSPHDEQVAMRRVYDDRCFS
jgi:hypothetical protein